MESQWIQFFCVCFQCYGMESSVFNVILWDPTELSEWHPNDFDVFLKEIPVFSMLFNGIPLNYWNGIQMNSMLPWIESHFFLMLVNRIPVNYWSGSQMNSSVLNVSIQVSSISMKGNSQISKLLKESSLSSMQLHD